MNEPLRIVHVEDSEEDVELIKQSLWREGFAPEIQRVQTRPELVEALSHSDCDLILSDYTLPGFSGTQALEIAHTLKPHIPFIFVSGTIQEETAIGALRNGATDYVLKDRPARLISAIRRALAETKEHAMHTALEKRLQQSRRLQAVSALAGDVARDVNRLLLKLRNQLHALSHECENPQRAQKMIGKLIDTTDEGSELMQQLLAFARRSEARLVPVDPSEFLREMAGTLGLLLPQGVEVSLQIDSELPSIFADPEQLRRILTNLVLNAKDAMPNGGWITISAEVVRFDPIPAYLPEMDNAAYFCLKVADTGSGMDEATRLRVFEPFFTTKPLRNGAGLGLPEVFGLMRTHNGLIDIQSKPGAGTVVSLFFPLSRQTQLPDQIKKVPPIQAPEAVAPF